MPCCQPPQAFRDTLLISDGFSCRFQAQHGAGRWAMHPAEVLLMARQLAGNRPEPAPERRYLEPAATPGVGAAVAAGALAAGLAAAVWFAARPRA